MRYEIDKDTLTVSVYQDGATEPFILQPNFPDGTVFADATEAEEFAKAVVSHHENQAKFPISPAALYGTEVVND